MSEKPTPEEIMVLEMYRQGKAAQAEKPAPAPEPPASFVLKRRKYPCFSEEYQLALHLMSQLAFAKLLPADLLECDEEGEGKLFWYFFENIAYNIGTGLDQIDIQALIQCHK